MAKTATKNVNFRALQTMSLRDNDERPTEFLAEDREEGTPGHVLTPGEEWHFKRSEADIQKLVKAGVIELLPDGPSQAPANNGSDNAAFGEEQ